MVQRMTFHHVRKNHVSTCHCAGAGFNKIIPHQFTHLLMDPKHAIKLVPSLMYF